MRLSSVVKVELYHGARRGSKVGENLALLRRFFQPFVSLPFDDRCAEHYGQIRSDLERLEPREARVVELRFFAGLSVPEVALALGVSESTVERDWVTARAWLRRELVNGSRG
ncbi:MAG: sigma-70 family RNA polymerase sigma factor [Thermoanaerobaculia bacterium]